MTSRWFPLILALLQTGRHLTMVAADYFRAAQNQKAFDVVQYVRRDFSRPLFEPDGFCGAWTHYSAPITALTGIDLPAYAGATLLHSIVTKQDSCIDSMLTPRGQAITVAFVPLLWFLMGTFIRRLARRRWHPRVNGRFWRAAISIGLIPLPIGVLFLLGSIVAIFTSDWGSVLRAAGLGGWIVYVSLLAAERLRLWPFHRVDSPGQLPTS